MSTEEISPVNQMIADLNLDDKQSEALLQNQTNWLDYATAKPLIEKHISSFEGDTGARVDTERRTRRYEVDVEAERQNGKLLSDETFIPVRLVNTNIKRETPRYVSYLMGGRLLALSPDGAEVSAKAIEALEKRHHQLLTYPGWLEPWFSVIDGACAHGVDYLEVVYDTSYPGHIAIEHIGISNLILNPDVKNVQRAPVVLRRYELSADDLRLYRDKFGFTGVDALLEQLPSAVLKDGGVTCVYKCLFRLNGIVHVAWYAKELSNTYLKDPAPLDLGMREKTLVEQPPMESIDPLSGMPIQTPVPPKEEWVPIQLKEYPIVAYRYYITDEAKLRCARGRVHEDQHYQVAISTMWSSMVNGTVRSSGVYGSPATPTGSALAETTVPIRHGMLYNSPLNFFSPPPPDPNMLPVVQAMYAHTVQEAGHFDYAARDKGGKTRPTATEVESSSQTTQQYSSVGLAMFSEAVRQVCDLTWKILVNLAEQDEIFLFGNRTVQLQPNGQLLEIIENDKNVIKQPYIVRAAGDIDVVQRGQRIQKLMEMWPMVAGTPLAGPYLAKLLRIALPEDGEMFANIIEATSGLPPAEMVGKLLALVQATMGPEDMAGISPEEQAQLQQLMAAAQQYAMAAPTPEAGASAPLSAPPQ